MNPLQAAEVGWRAARVNALPMVILWTAAGTLVLAYFFLPGCARLLRPLAEWQTAWGVHAAFLNQAFFSGLVPSLFFFAVRGIRTRRPFLKALLQIAWGGSWGVICWRFFMLQGEWFGTGHDGATLALKTMVDQFVWTPLVVSPLSSLFYLWMGGDFDVPSVRAACRRGFLGNVMLPNLVSGWCVWIPVIFIVYAFPRELQIQIHGFVCALWTLLCRQIGRQVSAPRAPVRARLPCCSRSGAQTDATAPRST